MAADGSSNSPLSLPMYPALPPQSPPDSTTEFPQSVESTAPPLPPQMAHTTTIGSTSLPSTCMSQGRSTSVGARPQTAATASLGAPRSLPTENLVLRVQYLESICGSLQREKKGMEEEFGRQRKKFMNNMIQMEAELNLSKQTTEKFSTEIRELSTQLLTRDEELNNLRMVSRLSDNSVREMFDAERVKYEEELALLRGKIEAQMLEHREAIWKERRAWQCERDAQQEELVRLRGVVASKVKLNPQNPKDSLETSMKKAAEDTQLLRSVVVPLEEEIAELQKKLQEATQRLSMFEGKSGSPAPLIEFEVSSSVADTSPGRPVGDRGLSPSPTEGGKLLHQLELERAARHDLEMHTKELKAQLQKMNQEFEKERAANAELKHTWELANQHFIVAQDQLRQEVYRLNQRLEAARLRKEEGDKEKEDLCSSVENDVGRAEVKEEGEGEVLSQHRQSHRRSHRRSQSSENYGGEGLIIQEGEAATLQVASTGRSASWSNLQCASQSSEELARRVKSLEAELIHVRSELSNRERVCEGYESQLQRVQEQMVLEMDDKERMMDRLRAENAKYQAGIMRERQLRQDLRRQMEETKEEMKGRIESFQSNEHSITQAMRVVRESFTEAKHEAQREVARFSDERVRLYGQISSAQEEYDCLKVLQSQQIRDHQQRIKDAMKAQTEAELNVGTLTEQLTQLQAQMGEREDGLCSEVALLKEQLISEQTEKERVGGALETTKTELQEVRRELERERQAKDEAVVVRQNVQEKSKAFIAEQQQQMEKLNQDKEGAEQHVRDLLRQVASLKSQLDTTQATQKDFVQLSQSLQVRLAEIEEQRQSEVHSGNSREDTPT